MSREEKQDKNKVLNNLGNVIIVQFEMINNRNFMSFGHQYIDIKVYIVTN